VDAIGRIRTSADRPMCPVPGEGLGAMSPDNALPGEAIEQVRRRALLLWPRLDHRRLMACTDGRGVVRIVSRRTSLPVDSIGRMLGLAADEPEEGLPPPTWPANRLGDANRLGGENLKLFESTGGPGSVALGDDRLERLRASLPGIRQALSRGALYGSPGSLETRTGFVERLQRRLAGPRDDGFVPAVLSVDLDDFKLITDSLGQPAADTLLASVSERIRACLRADDAAARLGGDNFGILIEDQTDLRAAAKVAQRLIDTLASPFLIAGEETSVTASIGIAAGGPTTEGADDLLREADVAMHTAKARGKGRFALFESAMNATIVERHELSADLQRAVDRNELVLHYQPRVALASGSIVGVEALVRWRHPRRGLVDPGEFIAIAEESDAILGIGGWVLDEACRQARIWQRAVPAASALEINVNMSARQVRQPTFVTDVSRALERTGLAPESLVVEVTEDVLLHDTQATIAKLRILKELGVRVALDAFGTGHASLGYLRRFPVDVLKIAREFIDIANPGSEEWAFAGAIVALGRTLGLEVVAEGIERPDQLERLRELGCGYGQGFLFARPLDAQAAEALLLEPDAGGRWGLSRHGHVIPFALQERRSAG